MCPQLTIALFFITWFASGRAISTQCVLDIGYTLQQASVQQEWALRMIDATTKIPDGLLYGNLDNMGHWDECLTADSGTGFTGKYCRVGLAFQNPPNGIFNEYFFTQSLKIIFIGFTSGQFWKG
jgi:hypothetical protein